VYSLNQSEYTYRLLFLLWEINLPSRLIHSLLFLFLGFSPPLSLKKCQRTRGGMLFYRLREARTTPDGRPIGPPCHTCIYLYVYTIYVCIYLQIDTHTHTYVCCSICSYVYRIIPEIPKVSHLGQTPCVESQGLIPWAKSSTPLVPPRKRKKKRKTSRILPVGHGKMY
jgi:hypothetical protein